MVVANTFILWLLGAAAFIGVAAVVHKRTAQRSAEAHSSTNTAA